MKILRRIKYYLIRLFRLKSGSHQTALGVVIGFSPCWFPTFGIGPMLSVGLAKLINANVVSALISAALGSFLWPILFLFNYKIGRLLTFKADPFEYNEFEYTEPIEQVHSFMDVGIEFVIGALFNTIVFGVLGYFVIYYIFNRYREVILRKLLKKH